MKFRMDQLLFSLSAGLDSVEKEILGATVNHGKRIAILSIAMGKHMNMSRDELSGLAACAILHDNALTEYVNSMRPGDTQMRDMQLHCLKGEKNASHLPFLSNVDGFIQYHHEFADKSGPFHMDPEATPIGAQLIAIADDLDIHYSLSSFPHGSIHKLHSIIKKKSKTYYTQLASELMLGVLDGDLLSLLSNEHVDEAFYEMMPEWVVDKPAVDLMSLSKVVAGITDYKSRFTAKHSTQIANRAYWMTRYYGFDAETCAKVYIAAAFHDIGKLLTPSKILEKPGKLTDDELVIIQQHVHWSYVLLKNVEGFEEICRWAVTHHRKMNGKGYPDLPEDFLADDFFCRLLACIDIYQAVRETRPYHEGRTHEAVMRIMHGMVERGEIDGQITDDLEKEMAQFVVGDGDVPSPF